MREWWDSLTTVNHVLITGGVMMVAALVAGVVVTFARRRALASEQEYMVASRAGFGVDELEAMRKSGQITDEEFRLLKRKAAMLDSGSPAGDNGLRARAKGDDGKAGGEGPPQA